MCHYNSIEDEVSSLMFSWCTIIHLLMYIFISFPGVPIIKCIIFIVLYEILHGFDGHVHLVYYMIGSLKGDFMNLFLGSF